MNDEQNLTDEQRQFCMMMMTQALQMLNLAGLEALQKYAAEVARQNNMAETFGVFTDPTAWIKASDEGGFENAKIQREIADHLIKALALAHQRDERVQEGWKR